MADIEISTLGGVIKTAYEGEANTNAFTDAEKTKLAGIAAEATQNATDAQLRDRSTHTGSQTAGTIIDLPDLLAEKVSAVPGKSLSDANFTQVEKDKLAQLEGAHFKGVHVGLAGLQAAHPTSVAGDYAVVDDGNELLWYQWDGEWVVRTGESAEVTPAQVKTYYESNPDTNAFTDAEKTGLASLIASERFSLRRRGTWNAQDNVPSLQEGVGTPGDFYVVTTPGTINFGNGEQTFRYRDWVMFFGGIWNRLITSDQPILWENIANIPAIQTPRGPVGIPQVAALAYITSNKSTPTTTRTTINWDAVRYDHFGIWNGGTNFVVPSWARHARISGSVAFAEGSNTFRSAGPRINGAEFPGCGWLRLSASGNASVNLGYKSAIVPVVPGDVITALSYHAHGSNLNILAGSSNQDTWVQVELFE